MSTFAATLLLAPTMRSRAYVQALAAAGLRPARIVLLAGTERLSAVTSAVSSPDLFIPDPTEPMARTLERAGWTAASVNSPDPNAPQAINAVITANQPVTIFSGPPGTLAGAELLAASPLLHMHSGYLPDYRGSTTLYYSWLAGDGCSVTALLLERDIDCGPILMRRNYPLPPDGIDVDMVYDAAIRADLLVRVATHVATHGRLPDSTPQAGLHPPSTFYVIHPVLKHLALLSRQRSASDAHER